MAGEESCRAVAGSKAPACFNEAPARWPGKRRKQRGDAGRNIDASMRPRLGGRGRGAPILVPLDCRLSFNEAPARWPGKREDVAKVGQPRHGFNEAPARWPGKRPRPAEGEPPGVDASMRPRLGGRGRGAVAQLELGRQAASMRPRLGGRGRVAPGREAVKWKPGASMRPRLGGRGRGGWTGGFTPANVVLQ